MKRRGQNASGLVIALLALLALSGSGVGAQTETPPEAGDGLTVSSGAIPIAVTLSISEIDAPGRLWLDESGLHIRELAGIDTVSGDVSGTATTSTSIDWAAPCHADTLICRGAQVSFQQLTITDDNGEWTGDLQLVIDPARGPDTITGILMGRRGNAGQVLYINDVTARSDASLSLAGYKITNTRPVGGLNLTLNTCLDDAAATGSFLGSYSVADSGSLGITLTRGIDTALGMAVAARFEGANGTLEGVAIEAETTDGGSAGRFVLLGGEGDYAGYLGFGRTGSQLSASDRCASGYELSSFWIGEVYLGAASR